MNYLFIVMDEDKVAHPEYLTGDSEVLDAVKRSVFDYRDGVEWDSDHIKEAEGIATTLIEDGYFPFEGDPPLYLFQLPDGEPVAWMHEFTDPHSGSRYREPRQHRPADYERQPGDTVRPLMYAGGVKAAPAWGPEHPDWKATHGCTHECRQGAQCKCDDEAKAARGVLGTDTDAAIERSRKRAAGPAGDQR